MPPRGAAERTANSQTGLERDRGGQAEPEDEHCEARQPQREQELWRGFARRHDEHRGNRQQQRKVHERRVQVEQREEDEDEERDRRERPEQDA